MGIDLEQTLRDQRRNTSGPNVDMITVPGGKEGCFRVGIDGPSNMVGNEKTKLNVCKQMPENKNKVNFQHIINSYSLKIVEPRDGMEFESKEDAFSFYKEYAKSAGFAVLIKASRRSRISGQFIDAKFACTRYGNKRESGAVEVSDPITNLDNITVIPVNRKRGRINRSWEKTDCKACMHVKRLHNGRWTVHSFIKEHNHELFPVKAYYFHGHRNLELGGSNGDGSSIRGRTKKIFVPMSRHSGGCKNADKQKVSISDQVCKVQHLALDGGDVRVMFDHFVYMQDENPNFFYSVDLNEEQRLRNVFWVGAKGRIDYANFGDVVFFDTTYTKKEYNLPFAPFIGVNHHFQFVFLGCSLVADGTKSTYSWLMQVWLRAMHNCPPKVMLTKQDEALKEAIAEILPDTRHFYCLWDIFDKISEKIGHVIRQHKTFMPEFNKCVLKSWTTEQFEKRWLKIADTFNLSQDSWFRLLYADRERWVPAYMKDIFLAGMCTHQRSDSISSFLEKYIQRRTPLKEFLDRCRTLMRDKFEEEAKADFETSHKQPGLKSPSPFGKQMAALYTHAIFKKFQVEVLGVVACHPRKESENGEMKVFRVKDFEENQDFFVEWNEATLDITCLCRSFEFNGYLCRHVMIVLQMSGIHSIPSRYVLKRWTKDAKSKQETRKGSNVTSRVQGYNDLCQQAFRLGNEGSLSQESYNVAFNVLEETLRKCESLNGSIHFVIEPSCSFMHDSHGSEEVNQKNSPYKTNKNNAETKARQGHSKTRTLDCSYEAHERLQGMEQPSKRAPSLDSYFNARRLTHRMANSVSASRDDYFVNQHSYNGWDR